MAAHLFQIPEHPRITLARGAGAQLEPRKPGRLHRQHGHAVADPAEARRLDLTPRHRITRNHDHGQVGAITSLRVGPPALSWHVDLGPLAGIQPYPHRRRPRHHVRRSQHKARPEQVPRAARAVTARPTLDHDLRDAPRLRRHALTPTNNIRNSALPFHRAALDQRSRGPAGGAWVSTGVSTSLISWTASRDSLASAPASTTQNLTFAPGVASRPTVTLSDISTGPSSNRSRSPWASASASFNSMRNWRTTDASSTPPTPTLRSAVTSI